MIDFQNEQVLTLADAAKLLPPRRRGRRPHPTTLARWAKFGIRGVQLEVICVGDTTCTSVQALQRFFDLLTELERFPGRVQQDPTTMANEDDIEAELAMEGM